jgi:hypothetical protein
MTDARHLSVYPITRVGKLFHLSDTRGRMISFHRTVSGALRKRRELIEEQELKQ